jgi:hypothetical protein
MKTVLLNLKLWTALMVAASIFASCSKDEDKPDSPDEPDTPAVVSLQDASVSGKVLDIEGNPVQGVTVTSGTLSASTGVDGTFTFARVGVVDSRSVIRFEKDGYFPVVRSGVKKDEIRIEIILYRKGNSDISLRKSFDASDAATLEVAGMEVAIPAGSLVAADGSTYSGSVTAEMLYLDPNNGSFDALMPGGDLAAIRSDNSEVQLISYGMTDVRLAGSDGKPLQLAANAESEMTFPVPEGMENNPPATIPLWYFDEERGIWIEEGTAARQGNVYVGKVRHFSWHNLDWPESRIEVRGKVTDCNNRPLDRVKVTLKETGGISHTAVYTDSRGEYSIPAPANTPLTVLVKSADYGSYTPETLHDIPAKPGGSVVTQDISLPCMNYVSGTLANTCGTVIAARIWLEYTENGQIRQTEPEIISSQDGKFRYRIPPLTGAATLYAESLSGERVSRSLNLDGTEQTVTFQLCMELTGLIITASDERGKGFSLAIPNEGFTIHIGAKPSSFPRHDVDIYLGGIYSGQNYSENYLVNLGWYGYEPGKTKYVSEPEGMWAYSGVWINEGTDSYAGDYVIDAYSVEFEILSRNGFTFRISVKADGEYWIPGGGLSGGFPVHIEGIIDAQLEKYNYSRLDVASHADFIAAAKEEMKDWEGYLHKPDEEYGETWTPYRDPAPVFDAEQIPALPLPYDEVFSSSGEGTDEFFNLCWKNATRATFDDIVQRFRNAGFSVYNVNESTVGYPSRPYFRTSGTKGDVYFEIGFDPEGGKLLPEYGANYGRPWNDENGFKAVMKLNVNR